MIINRDNYEGFFLLYTDNELKDTEREAVENFVKQNPDLAKELEILQRSTLANETLVFDQKEFLYRREKGISLSNYEEYFLLSADNELNKEQSNELEKFILKHPDLQKEFTVLKQTKLEPETILFANKEALYRKTKPKRIIPVSWMRMSVAAAFIALVAMTWLYIENNGTASKNNAYAVFKKHVNKSAEKSNQSLDHENIKEQSGNTFNKQSEAKNDVKNIAASKEKIINTQKIRIPKETFAFKKPENNVERKITNADNNIAFTETEIPEKKSITADEKPVKNENSNGIQNIVADEKNKPIYASQQKIEEPVLAIHAIYREVDTDEEDKEKSVFIGGADINKNKLKGFLKKAAVFLEKKSRKNDRD